MERIIDVLRADTEETIEILNNRFNTLFKDFVKEERNKAIRYILSNPKKIMDNKKQRYCLELIDLDEENGNLVINEYRLTRKADQIIEKRTKSLRRALRDKEMRFIELDNIMEINGFYSLLDDGVTSYIKRNLNVVYTSIDTEETEVEISFIIIEDTEVDEMEENFRLIITDVERI